MLMPSYTDPAGSLERLSALRSYGILDIPRESDFDELVELAAQICDAPISVVNLIEDHRQWFKAEVGLGIRETPLDVSICRHVLLQPGITIISDLRDDPRMCANPLVTGDSGLRFYAGCLLETPEGHGIGTLCILDRSPRILTARQQTALKTLANQVMAQMELRRSLQQKTKLLEQKELLLKEVNHRTKNNLQLIVGLIQLQVRQLSDHDARAALMDTSRRIMSISTVHERLYQSDEVGAVEASSYLSQVIAGIQATAPHEALFELDLDSVNLSMDSAIPLALVVNELLTNALKYAYPSESQGTVKVGLKLEHAKLTLTVEDAGQGLPKGFDHRKTKSLGMKIIATLCRQLDAEFTFSDNQPGVKCVVELSVPARTGD
ncbi:histidine kinase dimerization/phosphoacceptor domain -containing protein [Pseudomonas sp. LS-2]|uniref:histidine kinase dimerization/phosphoacceptor domain -containing protein n=2 Tax=Bacteria TaxID=2 RepID=UPI000E731EB3|nr:histidine kinase dimerization/phosphoacceptor domain -containing protein [Pseudomonas sp. LS-2]RJX74883.1 GAF domain-containing protein [Pseudomonas sp. LS-2]